MSSYADDFQGVKVFQNGFKKATKRTKKQQTQSEEHFVDYLWYTTYKSLWNSLDDKIQILNNEMFSKILAKLVYYIETCYLEPVSEIPTAVLLTGINSPDYQIQFRALSDLIKQSVSPHVAFLKSEDCNNMKHLVEGMIYQLVSEEKIFDELEEESETSVKIKKSQCNFAKLQAWYENLYLTENSYKVIVVIIPEFESFSTKILQDFIQIVNNYLNLIRFVFVLGVATSINAVHRVLPYHVSSHLKINIFKSPRSTIHLNNILEKVFFTNDCPFQLGGRVFDLFTDIFLFYDLSVSGFIQNFKYAMLEHFSFGNATALCITGNVKRLIKHFSPDDCENARRVLSFRKLVENEENPQNRIDLLTNDTFFKRVLHEHIAKLQDYIKNLHLFVRCLYVLVGDLPKAPLGQQVRQVYSFVVSKRLFATSEYKECFQLLEIQSREELVFKLERIIGVLSNNEPVDEDLAVIVEKLENYIRRMLQLDDEDDEEEMEPEPTFELKEGIGRKQLMKQLSEMSRQAKPKNKFERIRSKTLKFISKIFELYLVEPSGFYFYELFFFNDLSIQSQIIGSHRAAIHTALNDPQSYLECSCCAIPNETAIVRTMPDICIAYKLHLECGKMINLYDWLQAFLIIIDPQDKDDDSKRVVDPQLQARFTQAVAELEFLGFIKTSKRKTDHVMRLTWGG